jgi:hypothetical protein
MAPLKARLCFMVTNTQCVLMGPGTTVNAHKHEQTNFHHYGLHFVTLEYGARMNIGIVCGPVVFSR